jgi:hypothetical protein
MPVEAITYSFTTTQFPKLPPSDKTHKSTATTAQESHSLATHPATAIISVITEDLISNTVKSSFTEFEKAHKAAAVAFDQRMCKLETQVETFNQQVEAMTARMQKTIEATLMGDTGIIAQQRALITELDTKHNRMKTIIVQMAASLQDLISQNRARDTQMTASSNHPSPTLQTPPRTRKKTQSRDDSATEVTMDISSIVEELHESPRHPLPQPDSIMAPATPPVPGRQSIKPPPGVPAEGGDGTRAE